MGRFAESVPIFYYQNNNRHGPFEYHMKNIPTQKKRSQNLQHNHVLSKNQTDWSSLVYWNHSSLQIYDHESLFIAWN